MDLLAAMDYAIKMCELPYGVRPPRFSSIYPFTTENISGYIDEFNLSNKSLLTVGSSGDQVLNAILMGAKDITLMDINPLARYCFFLKMAAILELSRYAFLEFFCFHNFPREFANNTNALNFEVFNQIKSTLKAIDYDAYCFWNELLTKFSNATVRKKLFSLDEYSHQLLQGCNRYLSDDNMYLLLRRKIILTCPHFITGDINDILLGRTFDNIWLSNIFTDNYSSDRIKKLFLKFKRYLNDEGMMLLCYLYDTTINSKFMDVWADIYNLRGIFEQFKDFDLQLSTFMGVDGLEVHDPNYKPDSVLIYHKHR